MTVLWRCPTCLLSLHLTVDTDAPLVTQVTEQVHEHYAEHK